MSERYEKQQDEKRQGKKSSDKTTGIAQPTRDQERDTSQHPTMPPGRSDLALKRYENLNEKQDEHKDHSLQEQAKERAKHPHDLHAGTPYDWEDLEAYQKELERLDREGPKGSETP